MFERCLAFQDCLRKLSQPDTFLLRNDCEDSDHSLSEDARGVEIRRFRNTYLRNQTECPKGLRDYWLGHARSSMDDLYDKVKDDVALRKAWAEKCGYGFELPSLVPIIPRIEPKSAEAKAA